MTHDEVRKELKIRWLSPIEMPSSKCTVASSGYNVTVFEKKRKKKEDVFATQAPKMLQKKKVARVLYSLITLPCLIFAPVHLLPLKVYPGLQIQR